MSETKERPGEDGDIERMIVDSCPRNDLLSQLQAQLTTIQADCERRSQQYAKQADELVAVTKDRDWLADSLSGVQGALADAEGDILCIREDGNYGASVRQIVEQRDSLKARLAEVEEKEKLAVEIYSEYRTLKPYDNSRGAINAESVLKAHDLMIEADNKRIAAERRAEELEGVLSELHSMVIGECPSLLNEDSGGSAELDLRIRELLSKAAPHNQGLTA